MSMWSIRLVLDLFLYCTVVQNDLSTTQLLMQDDELDMSPVEIDDALMIEEDDISDDEDDDHDEVRAFFLLLSFY